MIPTAVLLACSTITAVCKTTTTGFEKGKEGEGIGGSTRFEEEAKRQRETRRREVVCTEGQETGVWLRRGLGEEGSVSMATSNPRDPRSSSPGLVEKGGPGRLSGRLGRAYSPNVTRHKGDTRMSWTRARRTYGASRPTDKEGRVRRDGRERGREREARAEERVQAGQDGRRRDTHHVNNTLLRRKTEPTSLVSPLGESHPPNVAPPSLSLSRPFLSTLAAFSSTTFRQPTHPPLDYIHENDDALSRRDFPRLLASARGN